ncbi:uncharacterized protein PITG_15706 [Phytophthora infestans T30-4]|uniref:PX domain-containing protein n=1 Tax=Phytophthora infestans (strain T30-4) TaxID=403677 RepID=D0NSD6_PHYIT|nr:uncharacterized protein PITG_15706 [Phytophthora infestans T30-4]EEY64481.1 conserved hypothetical protein [Phytophthora infestans T30-4]|eukprot:XP_002897984.1 conserved hypothetical protein [Phytophthora infestans T30-4]
MCTKYNVTTATPSLQQLQKLEIFPTRCSELLSPSFLDTIDHIEINDTVERDGVVFYRIDVFLTHKTSHIPTIKSTVVSDQPDYQLERRFNEFANLRYKVWMYAQRQHEDGYRCQYCSEFMSFIIHSMSQPRALIKLATGWCTGYPSIPHVVDDFFRK